MRKIVILIIISKFLDDRMTQSLSSYIILKYKEFSSNLDERKIFRETSVVPTRTSTEPWLSVIIQTAR